MEKHQLILNLIQSIRRHKRLYEKGTPEISDAEYDCLEEQLREIDPNHPILNIVGSDDVPVSNKVTHDHPMLSLEKSYDENKLAEWIDNRPTIGLFKIDGNSLSLIYKNGALVMAKTRGNGKVGEDVTHKALWVPSIPNKLPRSVNIEVRGELYIHRERFVELTEEMKQLNLDPPNAMRNIVAGLLGRKEQIGLLSFLDFFAFEMIGEETNYFHYEEEKLQELKNLDFHVPPWTLLSASSTTDLDSFLRKAKSAMDDADIGIDGTVFVYNELALHKELGETSHHPRYKLSFKWQGDIATSQIESIQWQVSRNGIVTPVAVIEPVELSGATITNVTLHNAAHIKMYNLKPGDEIEIVRSGEVIPKMLRVVNPIDGNAELITHCPSCSVELKDDGVRLICPNKSECPKQTIGQILHWIHTVEIDDLSEKRLIEMMDAGFVTSIPDLYKITKEQLLTLPLVKEKMAVKLFAHIQKTKSLPIVNFLAGLGLEGAGKITISKVLETYPTLNKVRTLSLESLIEIDGFSDKSATHFIESLKDKSELIESCLQVGILPIESTTERGNVLDGKKIVITGTLTHPRKEVVEWIVNEGGKIQSNVSAKTSFLVCNESKSSSSKFKKAISLGIPIVSESELMKIIGKTSTAP